MCLPRYAFVTWTRLMIFVRSELSPQETLMPINIKRIAYSRITGQLIADDAFTNSLYSFNLKNNQIERITSVNSHSLEDLDFDYNKNIISWTDIHLRQIGRFHPNCCKEWQKKFRDMPFKVMSVPRSKRSFVVFVSTEFDVMSLKWLDLKNPSITKTIISDLPLSAINLAHDESFHTLYFTNTEKEKIESVSLRHIKRGDNRFERKTICSTAGIPVGLAVSNGKVFWINDGSNHLYWVDLKDEYHQIMEADISVEADLIISDLIVIESVVNA